MKNALSKYKKAKRKPIKENEWRLIIIFIDGFYENDAILDLINMKFVSLLLFLSFLLSCDNTDRAEADDRNDLKAHHVRIRPDAFTDYDSVVVYPLDTAVCIGTKLPIVFEGAITDCYRRYLPMEDSLVDELFSILNDTNSYGSSPVGCPNTQIGNVFYKDRLISGHITMSLDCASVSSDPIITANEEFTMDAGDGEHFMHSTLRNDAKLKLSALFNKMGLHPTVDLMDEESFVRMRRKPLN